jgi:hypothetical protein
MCKPAFSAKGKVKREEKAHEKFRFQQFQTKAGQERQAHKKRKSDAPV